MEDYESFKKHIFELTQIDLNAYKEKQMRRRIDSLISKNNIATYDDYVAAIRTNKEMFDEFVNYLTINVSEFYRNPEQWEILEKEIFPTLYSKKKSLKIWSAACSTGDEPYSLAMLLTKFIPIQDIKIIATDIDLQVLGKAQEGLYNEKSIKGLPQEFVSKYMKRINEYTYEVCDEIKHCVEFRQHNLLKDPYPSECDLIICRNVLIYFTEEAKDEIYRKFRDSMCNSGILFVGSTEQIIQANQIGLKSLRSFFYAKKESDLFNR